MKLKATIVDLLDGRSIRIRLQNGHEMTGIVPLKVAKESFHASCGSGVLVLVTPFDVSKGVVILEQ